MIYYMHIKENKIVSYYCKDIHDSIPENSIPITEELWQHLVNENKTLIDIDFLSSIPSLLNEDDVFLDITHKDYFYIEIPETDNDINKEPSLSERIEILEEENAQLLIDSAVKDMKINSLESDVADILLELVNKRSVN